MCQEKLLKMIGEESTTRYTITAYKLSGIFSKPEPCGDSIIIGYEYSPFESFDGKIFEAIKRFVKRGFIPPFFVTISQIGNPQDQEKYVVCSYSQSGCEVRPVTDFSFLSLALSQP